MRVGWVFDPFLLRHDTGPAHPERPERLTAVIEALRREKLLERLRPLRFQSVPLDVLEWVHDPVYVELVRLACAEGLTLLGDRETRLSRDSFEVARVAAGGVLAACDSVMDGSSETAFCAVRPPGHHAERDRAMGYCLFNHIAVAAEWLIRHHRLHRVAVVDWDVHHGNGTQRIFEERAEVLYVSLHESPESQYPGSGYEHEIGSGAGEGFTLNVPMPAGSGDREYRRAFAARVIPRLEEFRPQFLLVSAGFDASAEDHTARINLEPVSFAWMTRELMNFADRHGAGRLVSVLEGGYDLPSLQRGVVAHVRELVGD